MDLRGEKPLWRKIADLVVTVALICGGYYVWKTGAVLKALEWLQAQDPFLLTVIAVALLMALAVALGGE